MGVYKSEGQGLRVPQNYGYHFGGPQHTWPILLLNSCLLPVQGYDNSHREPVFAYEVPQEP